MTRQPLPFRPRSRRAWPLLAAILLAVGVSGLLHARAQPGGGEPLRIAVITPTLTGSTLIPSSLYDLVGEAARMASIFAEENLDDLADELGVEFRILRASTPTPAAALRALRRMVAVDDIDAVVGGLGDGQAEALSAAAAELDLPFFNIGASDQALRNGDCRRTTFHVEASAGMYLDAAATWFDTAGYERWFVLYENNEWGEALQRRAREAIEKVRPDGVVASVAVAAGIGVYNRQLEQIRDSGADIVLLLVRDVEQITFLANKSSLGPDVTVMPFPDTISQTRDFYVSASRRGGHEGAGLRLALWEPTLTEGKTGELNDRFGRRFGVPMDSHAWSTYHAIKILIETVAATGSHDTDAIVAHLEDPDTMFDVAKGTSVGFRPWNHQLVQPLYLVDIDEDAQFTRLYLELLGLARLAGQVPAVDAPDMNAAFARLGDGAEESTCAF